MGNISSALNMCSVEGVSGGTQVVPPGTTDTPHIGSCMQQLDCTGTGETCTYKVSITILSSRHLQNKYNYVEICWVVSVGDDGTSISTMFEMCSIEGV
jgi:hypothetical protein